MECMAIRKLKLLVFRTNFDTICQNYCDIDKFSVYHTALIRWGHDECPSTPQLVYSERAGRSNWNQPAMVVYSGGPSPGACNCQEVA